jgi:hypothetical protein
MAMLRAEEAMDSRSPASEGMVAMASSRNATEVAGLGTFGM